MDQVTQIREKIDLVSLISEFIPLKKAGRNFKANCPFHNEKTPSFVISPERQIWHCFGCGKGGDCYTFLMEYEHIEFPEALRLLAKRAGITLVNANYDTSISSKKEKLYQINGLASEFYHYILTKHGAGKKALTYLKERGLTDRLMETFMLGFAPNGNILSKYLIGKKQYKKEELIDAGLAFERGRDIVDFFRNRIMFPLYDHRSNVVGFSGRVFGTTSDVSSKYINTRDTLVYHKGELFFGLNITKDAIKKANQAIILEGEFDVISCFHNGITNVVAVKGTALTQQQAKLLSRFCDKVTVCFDADKAGQDAIKRSLPVLEKQNLTTTVVVVPLGKDPDELLKENPGLFKKAIREDEGIYDYLLRVTIDQNDKKTIEGKRKISQSILPIISGIANEIVKEHYLRKLSIELETSFESVLKENEKFGKKESLREERKPEKQKRSREEVLEEYLLSL